MRCFDAVNWVWILKQSLLSARCCRAESRLPGVEFMYSCFDPGTVYSSTNVFSLPSLLTVSPPSVDSRVLRQPITCVSLVAGGGATSKEGDFWPSTGLEARGWNVIHSKNCANMLSRFHLIPERYRQTERRTESLRYVNIARQSRQKSWSDVIQFFHKLA